jgi:hypothetical protein
MLDGRPGLVWALNGKVMVVFDFSFDADGRITRIDQMADRAVLGEMTIEIEEG